MSLSASWQDDGSAATAARRKAFAAARRHSRGVRLLRILLPAMGLAAVVALFALTHLGLPIPLDLSTARLSVTPNGVVMEHPNLTGFDSDQREYSIAAERAIQSLANPDQVSLEAIKATIKAATGATVITAGEGHYDHGGRTLRLDGDIAVESAEGYALRMTDVDIDFQAGTLRSTGPVSVKYADSELNAERVQVTEGGERILFDGGVSATFMPPKRDAAAEEAAKASE